MNADLQLMIKRNEIGFEDVLEAYAQLCIDNIRDINEDIIHEEGVAELVTQGIDLSVDGLTAQAVEWAHVSAPEMLSDIIDPAIVKLTTETPLEYVIRAMVQERVRTTKAFEIKFS
jgi:hypothetical protein